MEAEVRVLTHRPINPDGLIVVEESGVVHRLPISPSKWEYKDLHRWAQIDREGFKPLSRRQGSGLRTLSFSILVAALDPGESVETRVRVLTGWAAVGSVIRIKNGSAAYQGACWWYVKDLSMSVLRVTPEGEPTQAKIDFALEEYVEGVNAVIKPPPPPPPPPVPVRTPSPAPVVAPVYRYHTTVRGDWLSRLAYRYLGRCDRWLEIYRLNRTLIGSNPNYLRVGLRLKIPPR